MRSTFLFLTLSLAARAGDVLTTTVEWISLSADAQALWVEGTAPDGPLTLELRVADDPLVLATRETIASNGRFSSLLRPRALPAAAYALDIVAGRSTARADVLSGTEEAREAYARPQAAWLGAAYERIVSLTDELHRFHDDCSSTKNLERWRLWSPGWEARRQSLSNELDEFRAGRGVLARAREFYRLVSSLCFAKTLHSLYAAELHSRGGEPGGEEASDWSGALAQQLDEFREARTPITAADLSNWVRDLADEEAAVRDRASRGLARAGEAARALLLETAAGDDCEAAARARELLERLEGRK
ncbi:MAG: hypothetical protein AAB074_07375 [Planctomycetota bacterium]